MTWLERVRLWRGNKPLPLPLRHGALGERAAKKQLQKAGLKFLAANFRSRRGEVDLIFRDADCLLFKTKRISPCSGQTSTITSWSTIRTIRFLSRTSNSGSPQTCSRFSAKRTSCSDDGSSNTTRWHFSFVILASSSATRSNAQFHRRSNSSATNRFFGSVASYWLKEMASTVAQTSGY
jgi:hypothetical protein